MLNGFPKYLWFKDYPFHRFEFLEVNKNLPDYALYICRSSSVEQLKRVHKSYINGVTKIAFLSQKELLEHELKLVKDEVKYLEKLLSECKEK